MPETFLPQSPIPAVGPSDSPASRVGRSGHRRTMRTANLLSAAMLATLVSALIVLAGNALEGVSHIGMALAMAMMWLLVFLGLSLFARAAARIALRLARSWRTQDAALTDQVRFDQARQDPQVSSDVQALLDADPTTDLPALFTAPRYCRYL